MAQRDYVSRGRSGARRKSTSRKKRSAPAVSKTVVALAVALLVVFVGGLYFITHNKPDELPLLPNSGPRTGNGLPPKPEERWRYIKELENRQIGVPTPTEPSAGGEVNSKTQLTNEQRQLLEQMQADMRQQPTQLSEVPYNQGISVPRSAVTITPPTTNMQQPLTQPPLTQPRQVTAPTQPQTQAPSQTRAQTQTQPPVSTPPRTQPVAPVTQAATPPKPEKEKEKAQRWMVQCGSFKAIDQAESIRAQLAFGGIESRITTGGGWNRVVLGPYSTKAAADKTLQRLQGAGQSGCIPLAVGG
ncbi:cell division protein FtsN [Yersinia enterocolitica]|uniref:Cell division protein FtsN n=1 Tax=Yersinia massiliensis TaxID=419257 RepID=A0ABM6UZS9_9GAMM|nr:MULTISPECIES: cell division protein FtsN [Yersinia]HEC1648983.1 cell division protein FtsN [Yersinia enterocolitica]ATM88134.1 cell division protein FtsN [Yersinia frederiksenii]AVX40126.1 cell division protein FtsN [Yersinia massiliensis]MCB5318895.1 cell division protein FtsN [Yersinia massiliensis]MDN0127841.1 cell division protein FtsN [Yersinia massiliensis]